MNSVLVTGATGKSGLYFLKTIRDMQDRLADYTFEFIVRNEEKGQIVKSYLPNSRVHIGDLNDGTFIISVFNEGNYNTLLHISGILQSPKITKAAVDNGVDWLILVHTTGIYSKNKTEGELYRQIENKIEEYIADKNTALTILRPTMIYGTQRDNNMSVFVKMVDRLRIFPTVNGAKCELQPVSCGDLGKAYYQVLVNSEKTKNKNYNLSGAEPIKLRDMFKLIAAQLGVKNTFISVPFPIAYAGAWLMYLLSFKKKDYREKVRRLVEPRVYSHKEATEDFDYAPVRFEDGVKPLIEEYKVLKSILNGGGKAK